MSEIRNNGDTGKKRGKIIILICIVIIAILIGVIAFLLHKKEEPKRNVVVTEENAEEVAAQMAEEDYTEPGYYTVNMATEWHFSKGDAISSDARVDNVVGNTNSVYFDLFVAGDEKEPIYSSPVIPVGSFLENIALEKPLEKGTYDCVMIYHLVDDDQETLSTLRVTVKVIVES